MQVFTTPDLCDQFSDELQIVAPLFKNFGGKKVFSGEVVTIQCYEDNSLVKEQVEQPGNERVLVIDGGGSLRCALLGDMLAKKAMDNGWQGLVIYGCVRDVDEIAQMNLGVQAQASMPLRSIRKGKGELNLSISFGGVTFKPGDYLYADNNGIVLASRSLI